MRVTRGTRAPTPPLDAGSALERPARAVLDLADLPTVVFGSRGLVWWGTVGFIVVETVTLAVCVSAYFYLWRNFEAWPPLRTPRPDLIPGTIGLVLLLAGLWPIYRFDKAARRLDKRGVERWLWVSTLITTVVTAIRFIEFRSVLVRWDANAYGSVVWAILVTHLTLLIADVFETGTLATIFSLDREEPKYYVDATDNAFYSYFMALVWVPAYVIVYLLPIWM